MSHQQELNSSTPRLSEFDPTIIPFQFNVLCDLESFDYSKGAHEILLSGSVGSAKTVLAAHIAVTQCLKYANNRGLLGRRSLPDLKDTLLKQIINHIEADLIEGKHYDFNKSESRIQFCNGSELICRSWADKNFSKVRSLDLGFAIMEEVTENSSSEFEAAYKEIFARVGRLRHIPQTFTLLATNPGSPAHYAYDYFIVHPTDTRRVYYSLTEQNPFLPKAYIENLRKMYTKLEARRMLYGEWVEIRSEFIYYEFVENRNIIDNYVVNPKYPINVCYDFNIGVGKPMSVCLYQYIKEKFYFFDEVVISGSNTKETCEEMIARGILEIPVKFVIKGDAAGRSKSSKYNRSDYDIIEKIFNDYRTKRGESVRVEIDVPLSNPPVRKRHNLVNGQMYNSIGEVNLYVTRNCKTLIKGFRLTKLKDGGQYIEDDSDHWQHITTAAGYGIVRELDNRESQNNLNIGSRYGT